VTRRRSSPRPFAGALAVAAERWAPETLLAEVQRVWPEIVGAAIAEQASPIKEYRGSVTVTCAASVWAQELDLMAPEIVDRLNKSLTRGQVQRLRCVTLSSPRGGRTSSRV
jgi:predicted nucleic acid-binding Zn ribbon protein